jgi:hypothetical protein
MLLQRVNSRFASDECWIFAALERANQNSAKKAVSFLVNETARRHAAQVHHPDAVAAELFGDAAAEELDGMAEDHGPETTWSAGQLSKDCEDLLAGCCQNDDMLKGRIYPQIGQAIRGSAMYWRKARSQLHALVNCIGPPDLFVTLSAKDLHWWDGFRALDPVRFASPADVARLSYTQRIDLINQAPQVFAKHFCNRVRALLSFLRSGAKPLLYSVTDYWLRLELQERGSPHVHMLLWCHDAPKKTTAIGEWLRWVDKIIMARLPNKDADPVLHELVSLHQVHIHSHTCRDAPPAAPLGTDTGGAVDDDSESDSEDEEGEASAPKRSSFQSELDAQRRNHLHAAVTRNMAASSSSMFSALSAPPTGTISLSSSLFTFPLSLS